jgi:hypothetical protein
MGIGDLIASSEGIFLAGTWAWVLRIKRNWIGWREKSALCAFLCASAAVVLDLILTAVMHFRSESNFAAIFFLATIVAGILLGAAGITLAIMSKGTPKLAALIWSLIVLLSTGATILELMITIWQ